MLNPIFTQRMEALLGSQDFEKYIKSFEQSPARAFHINTHKISAEKFIDICPFEISAVPFVKNAYYFDKIGIGNHPYHHAGMFYIQEPAAMFPVGSINIEKGWKILDMCASPGGKSSLAAQSLSQDGQLVSNEIIPSRCKTLCGNIERLGYKNVTVTCASSEKTAEIYPNYFDLVIVDAPCSGEGMFRKDSTSVSEWSEEHVISCAQRQTSILDNAAKCVRSGGYLLYSTCTFSLEENELMVDSFLKNYPNFIPVSLNDSCFKHTAPALLTDNNADFRANSMRRFYPFISKGEGQFAALLQNTADDIIQNEISVPFRKPDRTEEKIIDDFIDQNLTDIDLDNIFINKDNVIICDPTKKYPKNSYLCGVTLGQLQKGYIKPHHQLFSAFGDKFQRKVNFNADSEQLDYYLHGGSFHTDAQKGWAAVSVDGVAIGGCKVVDGYLKNHYPKGLHILK